MLRLVVFIFIFIEFVNLSHVTYYEILGVTKQASTKDIKQAYKKLAIKYHPDKNSDEEDQELFLKITEAYETLKDPDKRRNYDLYGIYPSYTNKYDYHSQAEYNNLYYNGLYHNDQFVDTISGRNFAAYLTEGFHFINFYSPFCPPCQNLVDHWKRLAKIYKGIVKIGAVNCKHHNSFCYNSMRIGSYPSLLFYPNGKNGHYVYYRGDRTLEALDKFIMTYLRQQIHVPIVSKLRDAQKAMGYVLGSNRIDRDVLTRIAHRLKGIVTIVIAEDDTIRSKLTNDEYTTIVVTYEGVKKEIKVTEESDIQQEIVEALPKIEMIDPTKLKDIRNRLRSAYGTPWVLFFSSKNEDKLLLHQMKILFPNMHFSEIDCDKWSQLCLSLQTETTPAWGVLKQGGGYQRASQNADVKTFLRTAPAAQFLHTLSTSELQKILDGDVGAWMLLVAPYQTSWEDMEEAFTQTSLHFIDSGNLHFGIMSCTANTDKYCHIVATDEPVILLQNGTKRYTYNRQQVDERQLLEFIDLIRDNTAIELNEDGVLHILDASSREQNWIVAHLPAHCGRRCDELAHQIKLVAKKLQPLDFVRVAIHQCVHFTGFCANVRSPTLRLYPFASKHHYTTNLEHLAEAPYILEWALGLIDDSVQKLNWNQFARNVISEDLNPSSNKKPWLVYFHSPRCYRCYEMYADFAIAGILLNNAVHLGKVNCLTERNVCQHEQITSYPSLKLYLNRNKHQTRSNIITLTVKDYAGLINDITPHLKRYDENLLGLDSIRINQGFHIKHDEF